MQDRIISRLTHSKILKTYRAPVFYLFIAALFITTLTCSVMPDTGDTGRRPPGDAGSSLKASLEFPSGMAIDSRGNIFIADRRANRVLRMDAVSGALTVFAGTGERSFGGDGGPAVQARLAVPEYVALDAADNLYIADRSNSRIRRVDAKTGIITTIAGTGSAGYGGDGGKATEAAISYPYGLTLDNADNIFIADTENHCVRRVDAKTGIITTIAGTGREGFSGDEGPAVKAAFARPHVVTIAPNGDLIIADSFNQRIRRVDRQTGIINTVAGSGEEGSSGNEENALKTKFTYFGALAFDSQGNLLVTGGDNRIRKIDVRTNIIAAIAGTGEKGFSGDNGPAVKAMIDGPYGMVLDKKDNIYFADTNNARIRRIDARTGVITTVGS